MTLQAKGVWSVEETIAASTAACSEWTPASRTRERSVKRAVAWLARNHAGTGFPLAARRGGRRERGLPRTGFPPGPGIPLGLPEQRIAGQAEMLRSSDESVKAIAARVGFPDQAYFTRTFRRITGTSPREFRGTG